MHLCGAIFLEMSCKKSACFFTSLKTIHICHVSHLMNQLINEFESSEQNILSSLHKKEAKA